MELDEDDYPLGSDDMAIVEVSACSITRPRQQCPRASDHSHPS